MSSKMALVYTIISSAFSLGIIPLICRLCLYHEKAKYKPLADKINATVLNFDVKQEKVREHLQVKGVVPAWLKGTLYRNGPINFSLGGKRPQHLFDGLAMINSFNFQEGQIH